METRKATKIDRFEIVELYQKSQAISGIPNPIYFPPSELGQKLYDRKAIERFVAIEAGRIVGHGLIETPNPENISQWITGVNNIHIPLVELGADFVDPDYSRQGIWTALLTHRLNFVREQLESIPVSATWNQNEHVKKTFRKFGGIEVATKAVPEGKISLFVF